MPIRKAHGRAAELGALLVVETSPADELPAGVVAATSPVERRSDGTLTAAGARALGSRGGRRKAERARYAARLADQLGLAEVGDALAPYIEAASEYALAQTAHLAATVGGGEVGPAPASIVHSAALALAASRYLYSQGTASGDPKVLATAARLGDQSKQALLTAHELCAREAQALHADEGDELRRQQQAFQARLVAQQAKGGSKP